MIKEQNCDKLSTSPKPAPPRHSLSVHKRPKQKVRKPSKEFLNTKSGFEFYSEIQKQKTLMIVFVYRRIGVKYR